MTRALMIRATAIDPRFVRALVTLIAALMLAILAGRAEAHHGWAEYDASKRATLTGTIDELHFGNPHVTIVLNVAGTNWNVMLASPSRLDSRGCTAEMLAVGATVTIEGLPHKRHADAFRAERIIVHGMTIELR